jgi:hypothetical protein
LPLLKYAGERAEYIEKAALSAVNVPLEKRNAAETLRSARKLVLRNSELA